MIAKIKEKYIMSFVEMAISSKGNNKFLEAINFVIDWNSIDKIFKKYTNRSIYVLLLTPINFFLKLYFYKLGII